MDFTIVSTIFNEFKRLPQTIADLEAQTLQPSEIFITDAGSNDGSWELLNEWQKRSLVPIRLLREERCNVARGRNLAINAATSPIILSTDFGCRFHPNWTNDMIMPFADPQIIVVGGAYGVQESSITTLAAKANYILTNGYELDIKSWFIPSSRSIAYYKYVWEDVGKYPEWLSLAADDLVFGLKLKAKKYSCCISEKVNVFWLRHSDAKQYAKESFRYGLGDGEARVNVKNTVVIIAEQLLKILTIFSLFSIYFLPISGFIFLLLSLLGFRSYKHIFKNWIKVKSQKYNFSVLLYSFFLFEYNRSQYLKAYYKGYFSKRPAVIIGRTELNLLLSSTNF